MCIFSHCSDLLWKYDLLWMHLKSKYNVLSTEIQMFISPSESFIFFFCFHPCESCPARSSNPIYEQSTNAICYEVNTLIFPRSLFLQIGHFLRVREHWAHETICPQGVKTTSQFLSMQILHSSWCFICSFSSTSLSFSENKNTHVYLQFNVRK